MKTLIVGPEPSQALHVRQVPDSALLTGGRPLFLRDEVDKVELTVMPAVRVSRLGLCVSPRFAPRYYDALTLVALNCDREWSEESLVADNALIVGQWLPVPQGPAAMASPDGAVADWPDLRPAFDEAVSAVSRRSTLKTGDIIVLAQPCGRYEARLGSLPRWSLDGSPALGFKIR